MADQIITAVGTPPDGPVCIFQADGCFRQIARKTIRKGLPIGVGYGEIAAGGVNQAHGVPHLAFKYASIASLFVVEFTTE